MAKITLTDFKNKSCKQLLEENPNENEAFVVTNKICNIIKNKRYISNKYGLSFEVMNKPKLTNTKLGSVGFEIYVKAWKDGKQIGFGADGTVEIERIRVYNFASFLTPDENGTIVKTRKIKGGAFDGMVFSEKYREDLEGVFEEDIAHTISIIGKGDENIIKGKIGQTTDTFNPLRIASTNAGAGYFATSAGGGTFATWRGATSATYISATNGSGDPDYCYIQIEKNSSTSYGWNVRAWGTFDTSSIPDSNTISSATISIKPNGSVFNPPTDPLTGTKLNITAFSPANPRSVTNTDMDNFSDTKFATDYNWSSLSIGTYSDLTLNASGLAYINKTGDTSFFWRHNWDIENTAPSASSGNTGASFDFGATNPQKLVVTHASAGGTSNTAFMLGYLAQQ